MITQLPLSAPRLSPAFWKDGTKVQTKNGVEVLQTLTPPLVVIRIRHANLPETNPDADPSLDPNRMHKMPLTPTPAPTPGLNLTMTVTIELT